MVAWTGSSEPPAPEPGAVAGEVASVPSPASTQKPWLRVLPFVVLPAIAVPVMVVSVLLDQPKPAPPDCAQAARCCLAVVNADPPAQRAPLKRCVEVATSAPERCPALLKEARATAEQADLSCEASAVTRYGRYHWTKQASTDHAAPRQRPPGRQLYPRVSCRKAAQLLTDALEQGRDGPWVVLRPLDLMVVAVRLNDPLATLYCDGFPLPATDPKQADPTQPIVYGDGPHAVLVRPERSGRMRVGQYCLGCNRVGKEPKPFGWPTK